VLYQDTLKCLDITTVTFHASSVEAKLTMIKSDQLLLSLFTTTNLGVALIPAFPKLHQQVNSMELKQLWVLYNGNTYQEFHKLLCTLLDSFGKSLQALSDTRGQTGNSKVSVAGSVEFKACVGRVIFYGNALQHIAKGSAIDSHLQNLEPLLNDHCWPDLKKVDVEDSDLTVLTQPMVKEMDKLPQPLWKSYKEWLVLMLAHFNAVETLVDYVTSPFFCGKSISIKILVSLEVPHSIFPWETMLSNPELFPVQAVDFETDVSMNKELFDFLKEATSSASEALETVIKVKDSIDIEQPNWMKAAKFVRSLGEYKLPNFQEYSSQIACIIEEGTPDPSSIETINSDLDLMHVRADPFVSLNEKMFFNGSLHCEASLASLFHVPPNSKPEYHTLSQHFIVS